MRMTMKKEGSDGAVVVSSLHDSKQSEWVLVFLSRVSFLL